MQDPGQLRLTVGDLLDDPTLTSVVGLALEVGDTEQTESSIPLQSKLRRLRVIFLDPLFVFDKHDYVYNDHKVGQMLKKLIEKELGWKELCKCDHRQDTCASRCGVRHLLL